MMISVDPQHAIKYCMRQSNFKECPTDVVFF